MESRRQSYYVFHKGTKESAVITRRNNITVTRVPRSRVDFKDAKDQEPRCQADASREAVDCPFRTLPKAANGNCKTGADLCHASEQE